MRLLRKRTIWVMSVLLACVMNGCEGARTVSLEAPSTASAEPAGTAQSEEMQPRGERQLVVLFRALLQMDDRPELTITREQASQLLPYVRRNSSEGVLTPEGRNGIVALLRPQQRRFYEELDEAMRIRLQNEGTSRSESLTPAEREQLHRELESARRQEADASGELLQGEADAAGPIVPEGENIERQLTRLLEKKLHP